MQRRCLPIALCALALAAAAHAQVKPASLFTDHMVLQRDKPINVWGDAPAGETVRVSIGDGTRTVQADENGRWRVALPPMPAGGPHQLRIAGSNEIVLEDVLVGEVWICSGQSNMEWPLKRHEDCKPYIEQANHPKLRLFQVPRVTSTEPQARTKGAWVVATPQTLPGFSAVGYGFGLHLYQALDVPVGLIQSAWGGTPVEAWTRRAALEQHDVAQPLLAHWDKISADYPGVHAKYLEAMARWKDEVEATKAKATNTPPQPRRPREPRSPSHHHAPGNLFCGMIHPLVPYSIRGAIWYQGESNAGRAYQYRTLFPAMIRDWRAAFGQGHFPFLFVQLANFQSGGHPEAWAELREAQLMTLSEPNTGMACIIDLGLPKDIHPPHKIEVGRRLSLVARAETYGEDVVFSGPQYAHMAIESDRIRLHFDHIGGGLVAKGDELEGFTIAGADGAFQPASARIDGDTIVVFSDKVPQPAHVRYAWHTFPQCNLYNEAGLPASPFRTDDLKPVTFDKR